MIVGVDVNLRLVTCCRLRPDHRIDFIEYTAPKLTPSLECPRVLAHEMRRNRLIRPDDVVWIERPSGRAIKSVADLSRVMGAFIASLPTNTSVEEVVPAEWKKLVGLPGNAKKPDVLRWAAAEIDRRRLLVGPYMLNEHRADALAVAIACERESARYTESESKVIA